MRIASIGGGPAGLYFAILMKQACPETEIDIYERNRADDTFGWGVVFSDETLGNFETALDLHRRALRVREAALGEDHYDLSLTLNWLATSYRCRPPR